MSSLSTCALLYSPSPACWLHSHGHVKTDTASIEVIAATATPRSLQWFRRVSTIVQKQPCLCPGRALSITDPEVLKLDRSASAALRLLPLHQALCKRVSRRFRLEALGVSQSLGSVFYPPFQADFRLSQLHFCTSRFDRSVNADEVDVQYDLQVTAFHP